MPDSDETRMERALNALETRVNGMFSSMEVRMDRRFDEVNRRIETQQFVHREAYEARHSALVERVEELEESKKWLARSLAFAFLVAFAAPIGVAWVVVR